MRIVGAKIKHADLSDQELVEHYQNTRDTVFVSELLQRYLMNVYGVCLKYLKNREDAKDMVMQIFEALTEKLLEKGKDYYSFKKWLYVVTKNSCLMYLRKENTIQKHQDEYLSYSFMENEEDNHSLNVLDKENVDKALYDCINGLNDEQKKCVELFYFDKKTYKDIALVMNIIEKKVKSNIQNGKRNLRICLEKKNEFEEVRK